ncbi:MAG: hypothetical protein V1723_01485 [Candidatus Uhrbacteria bacterium]
MITITYMSFAMEPAQLEGGGMVIAPVLHDEALRLVRDRPRALHILSEELRYGADVLAGDINFGSLIIGERAGTNGFATVFTGSNEEMGPIFDLAQHFAAIREADVNANRDQILAHIAHDPEAHDEIVQCLRVAIGDGMYAGRA